ncbi:MAG TPA: hypothetical protein ENK18_17110 [Deltaproteobacteria bacterium]|nr:hypothetical protein [Deltaproteobacteria bacterium]
MTSGPVPVVLAFSNLNPLYQGYFSTEAWVAELSSALGGCFTESVEVVISYSDETRIGRILIQTPISALACSPVPGPEGVDLSPLVPVGQALARYRDAVAAARDVRVASFRVGVRLVRGVELCDLYVGGQFPPDGTTFSPCLGLRGNEICLGDRHEALTSLPWPQGEHREILSACLGG